MSSWPHLYHHLHLSGDQSGQKFINLGGRSSGFTLALYLLDFTLNTKELNGLQPCQKNTLNRTQSCQELLHRKTSTKDCAHCAETPHFHILCIAELLRCFSLFWQLPPLAFFLWRILTGIAKCKQKLGDGVKDGCLLEAVTWWKMIHQFALKCVHNNRNQILSLLPLPFTNTWGKAFNNLTVSIKEARARLKWWQRVTKMHLEMQVLYWFFLDLLSERVCSTSVSVWSTVSSAITLMR